MKLYFYISKMRMQRRISYLFLLGFMVMCVIVFKSTDHPAGYSSNNRITEGDDMSVPASTFHSTFKFDLDKSRLKYPWKDLPTCDQYTVQLAERDSLPKWPLTSFPGSGVTWTRRLIEGVTGIYTGSAYVVPPNSTATAVNATYSIDGQRDDDISAECGCTLIDNDHEATRFNLGLSHYYQLLHFDGLSGLVKQQYDNRGVLLLRNPMDLVFNYHLRQLGIQEDEATPDLFEGEKWDEVVEMVAFVWSDHAIRWIEQIEKGTVLFYENLRGEKVFSEFQRLLNALDFPPVEPNRLRCAFAHRNDDELMHKKKNRFKLEVKHRLILVRAIHTVQQSLRRKGWPAIPVYLYNSHN